MELKTVHFKAAFGDEAKAVELTYHKGDFHIYIDRYYYGQIIKYNTGWAVMPQHSDIFTSDDMDAILERAGVVI